VISARTTSIASGDIVLPPIGLDQTVGFVASSGAVLTRDRGPTVLGYRRPSQVPLGADATDSVLVQESASEAGFAS